MFFGDKDIATLIRTGVVKIKPFALGRIQNNSYLLTSSETKTIEPGEHVNIWTAERIELPNNIVGLLTARSSISRQGLFFATSIGVDAGFKGHLVIEFFLIPKATKPYCLKKGDKIVHIWLAPTSCLCTPYKGKYQNQEPGGGLRDV